MDKENETKVVSAMCNVNGDVKILIPGTIFSFVNNAEAHYRIKVKKGQGGTKRKTKREFFLHCSAWILSASLPALSIIGSTQTFLHPHFPFPSFSLSSSLTPLVFLFSFRSTLLLNRSFAFCCIHPSHCLFIPSPSFAFVRFYSVVHSIQFNSTRHFVHSNSLKQQTSFPQPTFSKYSL